MYCLSGEEMWETVSPACWATSSNCGDAGSDSVLTMGLSPAVWPTTVAVHSNHRIHNRAHQPQVRINSGVVDYTNRTLCGLSAAQFESLRARFLAPLEKTRGASDDPSRREWK